MLPIRLRNLILLLALAALSGCYAGRAADPATRLRHGLDLFRNFRLEGVAELKAGRLALRKDIVIVQRDGALQADVVEGGLFGLSPVPLFHLRADSTLQVTSSLGFSISDTLSARWREIPARFAAGALASADSIAISHVYATEGAVFRFDSDLRISEVRYEGAILRIEYRDNEFHTLFLTRNRDFTVTLDVDRVTRDTP